MDCGYSLEPPQKHRLWYSLESPRWGGYNEYPQSMFWAEIWKNIRIFCLKIFIFLVVKFSIYLNRRVFVMTTWLDTAMYSSCTSTHFSRQKIKSTRYEPCREENALRILRWSNFSVSILGPSCSSIVSLTSSLVVKILTVLVSTISNSQVFFAEKKNVSSFCKCKSYSHFFSAKILAYMPHLMIKVLTKC